MENKEFDDILRNKLSGLSKDKMVPDWDRMSKQIDEDSLKDQAFDEQIKRKLEQLSVVKYTPQNWNRLYELIDQRIKKKQRILITKSLELTVVLLLAFTVVNLGTFGSSQKNIIPNSTLQTPQIIASIIDHSQLQDEQNTGIQKTQISEFKLEESDNNSINNTTLSSPQESTNSTEFAKNERTPVNHTELSNQGLFASDIQSIKTPNTIEHSKKSSVENNYISEETNLIAFSEIPKLGLTTFDGQAIDPISKELSPAKSRNWFVALSANSNINAIDSDVYRTLTTRKAPSNFESNSQKKSRNGSYALEAGYQWNKFSLSSGLAYQEIAYNPSIIVTTGDLASKYRETRISGLHYKILSLPINLNFKLFKFKSWKAEVQGGLIANLLLKSNERIEQNIVAGSRITPVSESNVDISMLNYEFNSGVFDDQPVSDLNKNKIEKSMFYRSNIGLVLSKKITQNSSIFTNVNYLYHLPFLNNSQTDHINTYSFGIGIKQNLG